MLTINQIFKARIARSRKQHYGDERLCLIGKKVGEKRKKRAFITYIVIITYFFYVQTGDTYY